MRGCAVFMLGLGVRHARGKLDRGVEEAMIDRTDFDGETLSANRPFRGAESGHACDHVQPTKLLPHNDFVKFRGALAQLKKYQRTPYTFTALGIR